MSAAFLSYQRSQKRTASNKRGPEKTGCMSSCYTRKTSCENATYGVLMVRAAATWAARATRAERTAKDFIMLDLLKRREKCCERYGERSSLRGRGGRAKTTYDANAKVKKRGADLYKALRSTPASRNYVSAINRQDRRLPLLSAPAAVSVQAAAVSRSEAF